MRSKMIGTAALAAMLLGSVGPGTAQDALKAAPGVFTQVLDNPRVRVLRATVKPGTKVAAHSHPDHIFYMLSKGTLVLHPPGRTAYEMPLTPGEALFLPAQTRAVENAGEEAVEALIVELKATAAPAPQRRGTKRPARPRKK